MKFLFNGPEDAKTLIVLAHGAGAAMDSPFMNAVAEGLAEYGHLVARFEFSYMARRREDGVKRPPSPLQKLINEWHEVIAELRASHSGKQLIIGGKSMGGRIASLVADEQAVDGLVCLGYPFHPPGKPEKLRTEHLGDLSTSTLIVQGTRDPFGSAEEVEGYQLSNRIGFHWAEDGEHSLKPRKASGRTEAQNINEAVETISSFVRGLRSKTASR